MLTRQLCALAETAVEEIIVVGGYRADQVRALCEQFREGRDDCTVTVVENEEYETTDNLYSLYLARDHVAGSEFVLGNGDVVYDAGIARQLVASSQGSVIACDPSTYSEEGMKITVDGEGYVDHISKDISRGDAYATSIDLYKFSAPTSHALFEYVVEMVESENERTCWTELAIDRLVSAGSHDVRPLEIDGYDWVEIDDEQDLLAADRAFSSFDSLRSKAAVFFDLDGTLYLDDDLLAGAADLIAELREGGTDVYFLTNNSSRWKTDYVEKLTELGIPARTRDVVISTDGVIRHCLDEGLTQTYVVGTTAMRDAFEQHGIDPVATDPQAVVVGFDTELTYEKLRRATLAIRGGAKFLLAHPDLVCPTADGFVPDCGSIGALIEAATDRSPDKVFGKPDPDMLQHVLDDAGLAPEEIAIVGDRLETEIRMAERLGCEAVCVLTGAADRRAVEESKVTPSLVVSDLTALGRNAERQDVPGV